MSKTAIRDFSGLIIGWIEEESNGNKTVRDFEGRILGYYNKSRDVTTDFSGRVLTRGDSSNGLIWRK